MSTIQRRYSLAANSSTCLEETRPAGAGPVILLDTNYLIGPLVEDTREAEKISPWLEHGEELCTSSIARYEFLSGPVEDGH